MPGCWREIVSRKMPGALTESIGVDLCADTKRGYGRAEVPGWRRNVAFDPIFSQYGTTSSRWDVSSNG